MANKMSVKAKTVLVGMSGGVDSSAAAALLLQQDYRVIGVAMKTWAEGEDMGVGGRACFSPEREKDIEQARRVAAILSIPFHVIDLSEQFKASVLDYFCRGYLAGRTPNPCVRCNRLVKFGALWEESRRLGLDFDYFATGHYARVECDADSGRYLLKRGLDGRKDQSYFLYGLTQDQLVLTLFPLGKMHKSEARELCRSLGLGSEGREESQDFAGGRYTSLFTRHPGPGKLVDAQGRVLGQHRGIIYYTPGQRHGLGLAAKEPLYVIEIRAEANEVVVGRKEALLKPEQTVGELNWIALPGLEGEREVRARIRSTHAGYSATISPLEGGRIRVVYTEPRPVAARGQSIVFYEGDTVIGGGIAL